MHASLIVDGHHLPFEVVKTFLRAKTDQRCILVSDITAMAGMKPGKYETSLGFVEVLPNGRLVVAGQKNLLAGASLPIGAGIVNVMRFANVKLKTAVEMATRNPLKMIGETSVEPRLHAKANFVLFDLPGLGKNGDLGEIIIRAVINHGELVYRAPSHRHPVEDRLQQPISAR